MEDQEYQSEQAESTSGLEESVSQTESSEGAGKEVSAQVDAPQTEQYPLNDPRNPFYERFTELTSQNREFKGRLGEYDQNIRMLQQQLAEMKQASQGKPESPYKPVLDHLRTLNPDFAKFQEELISRAEKAEERSALAEKALARLDEMERRDFNERAVSRFKSLLGTNKVPDDWHEAYEAMVIKKANQLESSGQKLGVEDVDKIFSEVHQKYQKVLEKLQRSTTASYVKEKIQDKTPTGTTGGAAVAPGSGKFKADDEQGLIKWMASELRRNKNAI